MKNVLIVRLDAIGDYILWRNVLAFIRQSAAYRTARITILGNPVWRGLAEMFDANLADEWIWVEGRAALFRKGYENLLPGCIWRRRVQTEQEKLRTLLKARHFDEVISPQAFPDEQLDSLVRDIAPVTIGVASDRPSPSVVLTRRLDPGKEPFVFLKNRSIATALTGQTCDVSLSIKLDTAVEKRNEVIFFVGASHWTRRWPMHRWNELARLVRERIGCSVAFAGRPGEPYRPFHEFVANLAGARAVVSNDTMALHLAAALDIPTVAVVNGVSGRDGFWPYPASLGKKVAIVEPSNRPSSFLPGIAGRQIGQYAALASIGASDVFCVLSGILAC